MASFFYRPKVRSFARSAIQRLQPFGLFRPLQFAVRLLSPRSHADRTTTIADLDALVARAPSLDRFLDDASLIEGYFKALRDYFGAARFPRQSFQAILEQVKRVAREVPGFGENLWRVGLAGCDFEIKTAGQTTGRRVQINLWRLYRFQWLSSLRETAGLRESSANARQVLAQIYLRELQARSAAFEIEIARGRQRTSEDITRPGLSRRDARLLRAHFYSGFRKDRELASIAAFFLYSYLTAPARQRFFQYSDADLIIGFFKELKQNPRAVTAIFSEMRVPSALLSAIKRLIPSAQELLSDHRMFPLNTAPGGGKITVRANYVTRFIRPFHAIWLGIPENDCLAGDPGLLEFVTPERWAVSALAGAVTTVIEKNGRYQGFARFVPLKSVNGEIFASFEAWAPVLAHRVVLVGQHGTGDAEKVSQLFFDSWYPKLMAVLPKNWKGLVVSESAMIDNAGVKLALAGSGFWSKGHDFGSASSLEHIDSAVNGIKGIVKPCGPAIRYCSDMIFDAKIPDAGRLRILAPPPPL